MVFLELWRAREAGLGATAHVPGRRDTWEGWEDSAVPPERLGSYLRDLDALYEDHGYLDDSGPALYGHFGHGCVHTRIPFDLYTDEGVADYRSFLHEAADLVCRYGGSLSGEHGDGQTRGELLPRMFGDRVVEAFRRVKAIFDPGNLMNPGKVVDPYPLDSNLRLGGGWRSDAVHDALDLCLACKGCKSDCPVNVDMATYKAEFLSRYWEGRLRPRGDYALGWLPALGEVASRLRLTPAINALTQRPRSARLAAAAAGLEQRPLPRLAPQTLKAWAAGRSSSAGSRGEQIEQLDSGGRHPRHLAEVLAAGLDKEAG